MAFKEQCDLEFVIPFDGIIVYDKSDIRWWTGTTEDGLKIFIKKYLERNIGVEGFRIFRNGEYIETVKEYMEREIADE